MKVILLIITLISFNSFNLKAEERSLPFLQSIVPDKDILPLPFGISATGVYIDQPFTVILNEIKLPGLLGDINIAEDFELDRLDLVLKGFDRTYGLQFDTWVFPFLNLFVVLSKTDGKKTMTSESLKQIDKKVEDFQDLAEDLDINVGSLTSVLGNLTYTGMTYGAGAVIALGYGNFFTAVPITYTKTYVSMENILADSTIDAFILQPRFGYNINLNNYSLKPMFGGMFQYIKQEITGFVEDSEQSLTFKVEQIARYPWNLNAGISIERKKSMSLMLEAGFLKRRHIIAVLSYRF